MAETISANPNEVTLLAVGPMTNVAKLFERHPASAAQLKEVVLMCGRFRFRADRSARCRVECLLRPSRRAAGPVFRRAAIRAHGLDVTTKVRMEASEVRERFAAPLLQPVLDMAEEWFSRRPVITFHDPLAAVAMFDENLCSYENGSASVVLDDGDQQGLTEWQLSDEESLRAAFEVNTSAFFERYFKRF